MDHGGSLEFGFPTDIRRTDVANEKLGGSNVDGNPQNGPPSGNRMEDRMNPTDPVKGRGIPTDENDGIIAGVMHSVDSMQPEVDGPIGVGVDMSESGISSIAGCQPPVETETIMKDSSTEAKKTTATAEEVIGVGETMAISVSPKLGKEPTTAQPDAVNEDDLPIAMRLAKRNRSSPDKYTPPVGPPKKPKYKKNLKVRIENSVASASLAPEGMFRTRGGETIPTKPVQEMNELPVLLGGFRAFDKPNPSDVAVFLEHMSGDSVLTTWNGSEVGSENLVALFNFSSVLSEKALELAVMFIQLRRDRLPNARYDFISPTFASELKSIFNDFTSSGDKAKYLFSTLAYIPFVCRPKWIVDVNVIYCPMLTTAKHWVGMVLDLNLWAIFVIDCNTARLTATQVEEEVTPISVILPYLLRVYRGTDASRDCPLTPLPVTRLDLECMDEHPGHSVVTSLVLLEMHATGELRLCGKIRHDEITDAANHYAIEAFRSLKPEAFMG